MSYKEKEFSDLGAGRAWMTPTLARFRQCDIEPDRIIEMRNAIK